MAAALIGARVTLVMQAESASDFAWRDGEMLARLGLWLAGRPDAPDFPTHRASVERSIAITRSPERFRALGMRVLEGRAVFVSPNVIRVGDEDISARRFVIATGRAHPGDDGTLRRLLAGALPERIAIGGGSAEGLCLAQIARRLGADVTVVGDELLPEEEPEAVDLLATALRREGIGLARTAPVDVAFVTLAPPGPALNTLDCGTAGIGSADGHLLLDKGLGTTNRRVFAIGSVASQPGRPAGGGEQVPALFKRLLLGFGGRVPAQGLRSVATVPALAAFGLTEHLAAKQSLRAQIVRQSLPDAAGAGLIKLIIGRHERLLGVTIVHPAAASLIAPWALAWQNNLPASRVALLPAVPTPLAEATRAAAGAQARQALGSPLLSRLSRLMRLLP